MHQIATKIEYLVLRAAVEREFRQTCCEYRWVLLTWSAQCSTDSHTLVSVTRGQLRVFCVGNAWESGDTHKLIQIRPLHFREETLCSLRQ